MGQSRGFILVVVLLLSLVIPAALCVAVLVAPARSILDLALLVAAAGATMALLALVNWWEFTSVLLRWLWLAALAVAAVVRVAAASALPAVAAPGALAIACAAVIALAAWGLATAVRARTPPGPALPLRSPLAGGQFLVTDGGDGAVSFLVNYHYGFGTHRASGVNASMRFATDVVEIGPWGGEARGLLPARNDAYAIWEHPLLAPCDGEVVHVVDDVQDNEAFGSNRPYGVGNHVVIRHGADVYIVLGHMRRGSIRVARGQRVEAGDCIGAVGNSGWTERPHLHIQAMRSPNADWWHGEPVPLAFDGQFPIRNATLRANARPRA